jgi:putative transposase
MVLKGGLDILERLDRADRRIQMPRISRAVAIGYPHHVLQRGNYRQPIFGEDIDYLQYLHWLEEYSKKFSLKIWAYCLMSNHVHYVAVPMKENSLGKTFNFLHMKYSLYFNQKRNLRGHLWQGRFYSCILDNRHVYAAVRYVENNPVRANLVDRAYDYAWSSARYHVYKEANPILADECYLIKNTADWLAYLMEKDNEALVNNILKSMKTGRPCGDEPFVRRIEELLKRKLTPLPRGRPPKLK